MVRWCVVIELRVFVIGKERFFELTCSGMFSDFFDQGFLIVLARIDVLISIRNFFNTSRVCLVSFKKSSLFEISVGKNYENA